MTLSERYRGILDYFSEHMPQAQTELVYGDPFQLLVAVILSAQCTDKRVNMTTPALFGRFPDAPSMAAATPEEILPYIKSISYPNSKALHLSGMARKLVSDFDSRVPSEVDKLMSLPGVGRKTANVMVSVVWNEPVIAVDTHVFRVSRRLGLSRGRTPEAVEKELERHTPEELRPICHHWLILHGRYTCTAKSPKCGECPLRLWCRTFEKSI